MTIAPCKGAGHPGSNGAHTSSAGDLWSSLLCDGDRIPGLAVREAAAALIQNRLGAPVRRSALCQPVKIAGFEFRFERFAETRRPPAGFSKQRIQPVSTARAVARHEI